MSQLEHGGPAFPVPGDADFKNVKVGNEVHRMPLNGMSLRDYFAAKAMQGLCAGHIGHYGHES